MTESDSDGQLLTCKFNCIIHGIDAGCGKRMARRYFAHVYSVLATVAMCVECNNSLCRDMPCGCRLCMQRRPDRSTPALELHKRVEKKPTVVKKKPVSSSATTPKKPRSVNKPASSSATNHKTPTTMKKPAASPAASGEAK